MCRMLAACPGLKKDETIFLLKDMMGQNTDGFGFTYVNNKGEFIIKKTTLSLEEILKKKSKKEFLNFPSDRWVLIHMRKSSIGAVCHRNVHPFIIDNEHVGCHNGSFRSYELVKAAMDKQSYSSDTDSEVALKLLVKIGAKKFNKINDDNGVYLVLNKNGELCAVKNTFQGDLKSVKFGDNKTFLVSELPFDYKNEHEELDSGCYLFNKHGELTKSHVKKDEMSGYKSKKVKVSNGMGNIGYCHVWDQRHQTNRLDENKKSKLPFIYTKDGASMVRTHEESESIIESMYVGGYQSDI